MTEALEKTKGVRGLALGRKDVTVAVERGGARPEELVAAVRATGYGAWLPADAPPVVP